MINKKISIITVVLNGEKYLEETIKSVINQDYKNIEYIIIDGGSNDGTQEIISRYRKKISYFLSESDSGIYDAMNKGISISCGDWINFMNAGDVFYNHEVIARFATQISEKKDIYFGSVEIRYPEFKRVQYPGSVKKLWSGMQFSHQSIFFETNHHKKNLYNLKYLLASDLNFLYKSYREGASFGKLDFTVASVLSGGVSDSNRAKTILESANAVCDLNHNPIIRAYFFIKYIDLYLRLFIKKILPSGVIKKIILKK